MKAHILRRIRGTQPHTWEILQWTQAESWLSATASIRSEGRTGVGPDLGRDCLQEIAPVANPPPPQLKMSNVYSSCMLSYGESHVSFMSITRKIPI